MSVEKAMITEDNKRKLERLVETLWQRAWGYEYGVRSVEVKVTPTATRVQNLVFANKLEKALGVVCRARKRWEGVLSNVMLKLALSDMENGLREVLKSETTKP